MERQEGIGRSYRGLWHQLGLAAVVCLAGLALSGQARAGVYFPSQNFNWLLPPFHGANYPSGIAVSPDGNLVYVADGLSGRVIEYASDGALVRDWPQNKPLGRPTSIATDGVGDVYVLYGYTATVARYSADGKKLFSSWNVPFARSIAVSSLGHVFVLTNFLNAVGVFNAKGQSIGGFVADLPGQYWPQPYGNDPDAFPQSGYDSPYKTVAKAITVDPSGRPIVVGESYQALSNKEPDCSAFINQVHVDFHPYPDPLISGEAARFTPGGVPTASGWLSESPRGCLHGWYSDGLSPTGVAIDPNTGQVYAAAQNQLGAIQLRSDYENSDRNVNTDGSSQCCVYLNGSGSFDPAQVTQNTPPSGVAVDCRSNLYVLYASPRGRFVVKFLQEGYLPPSCSSSRFPAAQSSLHVFKLGVGKLGPMKVLAGCSGRLCAGSLALRSSSALCPNCMLSAPRHFRIRAGLLRTLTLQLNGAGRRLLRTHAGLPIKLFGRLKGGRRFSQNEALRAPATLGARCSFAGTFGGPATVAGTLLPSHAGERIRVEYLPPQSAGVLLPAVQHTALTNHAGHFSDRLAPDAAGKWMVFVSWAGDRTREPAGALPCAGTVAKIPTQVSLACPTGSSAGSPAQFSGALSVADAPLAVVYQAPSGATIGHDVSSGITGNFSDTFSPSEAGAWQALAHYQGDANHTGAEAVCRFAVAPDDFSISVVPSAGSAAQGGSVNATVNTAVTSGSPQTMSLSASGAPGAVTFSPATITSGASSNVTISVPAGAAPGSYAVTITGAGAWATHSTTYRLTVLRAR